MAVTVNSQKLQRRLRDAKAAIQTGALIGLGNAARATLDSITAAVRAEWGSHNQVGFDLESFITIIQKITVLPGGYLGLLNEQDMGDAEMFERIRGYPGLWHQGTGQGEKFGLFVNQQGMFFDQVSELAEKRKAFWFGAEPQWFLIEYGTTGYPGAFDPQPPKMTITQAAFTAGPTVRRVIESTVSRLLRERGVYT